MIKGVNYCTASFVDRWSLTIYLPFEVSTSQILAHQRDSYPLQRPECCPDWVYILIHQCWAFTSEQRPPFLAIFDCLTSRYVNPGATLIDGIWSPRRVKCDWLTDFFTATVHLRTCEPRPSDSMSESLNIHLLFRCFLHIKLACKKNTQGCRREVLLR